ncbi:HAD family hydrolase [Helicobacter sp.]|uniref:HAD family hydrolase n=1 Tax=Helicobacter sp. TaxID=218 RepID=UPI0019A2D3F5|nr:HAD family hydrolase [Helicobacter sp.]MBD5165612.1 HAD family hydrolase [Helicobacter sp.]
MKDKIILFDLDGTLIDSTEAVYEGFCEAFRHFHQPLPSRQAVVSQIGNTLEDMFSTLNVKSSALSDFIRVYREHYGKICNDKTYLLESAKEAILQAQEFAYLGVVTTKLSKYSKILLDNFGVLNYFHCVIGREDVKEAKPSAEPILLALESMPKGISRNNIYMVGDTPLDIQAANNANIKSIGILSGYASLELLQQYTNHIAKDALEAVLFIKDSESH